MQYLCTNEIVGPRISPQGDTVRKLVENDVVPRLVIVRDEAGAERPDIRSYTAALRGQMERVRQAAGPAVCERVMLDRLATVRTLRSKDMRYFVEGLSEDPEVDSVIVMSPTEDNYDEIVAGLSPGKDVDGMNPNSRRTPCTPDAVREVLDHHGLWTTDYNYALIGRGRTVGTPLNNMLRELHGDDYDERVHVVSRRNKGELDEAVFGAQVAIIATGVKNQFRPDLAHPGLKAAVGICIGDIDPRVYEMPGDLFVTPEHGDPANWGVGINTSSLAIQGTLNAAVQRLSLTANTYS